jgi:lipoprotein-anchoring transpeptidase ErfK/SrfK
MENPEKPITEPESLENSSAPESRANLIKRIRGHHNGHWWFLLISSVLLVALSMTWLIGTLQYKQIKVGNDSLTQFEIPSKLDKTITEQVNNYRIKVTGLTKDSQTKAYKLSDAGIYIDVPASIQATHSDVSYWRNRLLWWQPRKARIVVKTDEAKLINFVNKKTRVISKQVKNAKLSVGPEGRVKVTKEATGTEKSLGDGRTIVYQAVQNLDTDTLELTNQTIKPSITQDSIQESKKQLEEIVGKSIKFNIESNVIKPTAHDIASWLLITPNEPSKSYNITVDKTKLTDYINGQAGIYIRQPINQVEITMPNKSKSVLVAGQNGSDVINKAYVIKTVQDQLLNDQPINLDLKIAYTPFKTVSTPAGAKLIEVDVTKKVMYAYENNVLLKTMYVSAGAPATPTVLGTYKIYSKIKSQNMRGFNADGSTYFQPAVPYVNYFYRDYAVHGNYWRPASYFGNVNSSHGCVGIQNGDAEWIYNWAPIGTPVVVHL